MGKTYSRRSSEQDAAEASADNLDIIQNRLANSYMQLKKSFGESRIDMNEYKKRCREVSVFPDAINPSISRFYKLFEEPCVLHEIMLQPFMDSRDLKSDSINYLVVSYPEAGASWIQEIAYLVARSNQLDIALTAPDDVRLPFLDVPKGGIRAIEALKEPTIVKSHWPYELLPEAIQESRAKIIYVARNPKDTAVAYYWLSKRLGYFGNTESFRKFAIKVYSGPTCYSTYSQHFSTYWKLSQKNKNKCLFLFYENFKKNMKNGIQKIAVFMHGKQLDKDSVDLIIENCSHRKMHKNSLSSFTDIEGIISDKELAHRHYESIHIGNWRKYFRDADMDNVERMLVESCNIDDGPVFQYK